MNIRCMVATGGFLALLATSALGQPNTNLIVNADAESGPSSNTGDAVGTIPG